MRASIFVPHKVLFFTNDGFPPLAGLSPGPSRRPRARCGLRRDSHSGGTGIASPDGHRPAEERGKAACRVRPGRGEAPGTARKGWFISLFLGRPAHDKCASGGKPSWARFPAPMPPQKNQLHSLPQDSGLHQRTNRAMEAVSTTATPMPHMALPSMIEEREEDKRAGSPAPKGSRRRRG